MMNSKITGWRFAAVLTMFGFFVLCVFITDSNAQTARRSKTRKAPSTVQPMPSGTQGDPMIISRADEFPNGNQVVVQPVADSQTETKTENTTQKDDTASSGINDLSARIKNLEDGQKKNDPDAKQKRLMLNLDILTRAEQRAESLRKQLFDVIERENQIKTKLDQIEYDIRPEMLERSVAFAGSLRPEELRDNRRKSLTSDKRNLETLLTEIQNTKTSLETNVQKADILVEKLRAKLEKQIDDALVDEPNP